MKSPLSLRRADEGKVHLGLGDVVEIVGENVDRHNEGGI